jgi:uncharacterized protein YndB with AHSA1/START domain
MADYHFFTTWDLEAPIEAVWEVIGDPLRYPSWWKYVANVTAIEPSPPGGSGGLYRYHWKTVLLYSLSFEMRHTRHEPPHLMEGVAKGELDGVGLWELHQMDGFTRVTYDWRVSTTKPWMNLMAPIGRPAFSWNHDKIMQEGGRALAARLGVRLLAWKNETLGV